MNEAEEDRHESKDEIKNIEDTVCPANGSVSSSDDEITDVDAAAPATTIFDEEEANSDEVYNRTDQILRDFDGNIINFEASEDNLITDADRASLAELKEYMPKHYPSHPLEPQYIGPGGDMKLIRFLRRNKHVPQTARALAEYIQWRQEWHVGEISIIHVAHVFEMTRTFRIMTMGDSKLGQPAVYIDYDDHTMPSDVDLMLACLYCLEDLDIRLADSLSRVACVLKLTSFKLHRYNVKMDKMFAKILDLYYPERLGPTAVVEAGLMFRLAWKMVRHWVPADMAKFITVMGKDPTPLHAIFDHDAIPKSLGGGFNNDPMEYIKQCCDREGVPYDAREKCPVDTRVMLQYFGSDEIASEYSAVVKGVGSKRTKVTRRWNRYYLVLTNDTLFYFKSSRSTQPNNAISMAFVSVEDGGRGSKKHTLTVTTAERPYYFSFTTAEDKHVWLEALKKIAGECASDTIPL
ncbi:PH domain [Carpediemonas membranifera]|uniref:PH domain n=1 Tax=Carpediemonas membranifera TaxID=201153 RepID=A0A8J6AUZ9_9EUKA|nr:PH domain [Carpediemonas membranifera]|eukprot:KAG9395431.1 PH domain [Carpediemonas membranifera]